MMALEVLAMIHRHSLLVPLALVLFAAPVAAQQDTTPPVLLDFAINPVVFDTGTAPVGLSYCVEASDDLSGISGAWLNVLHPPGPNEGLRSYGGAQIVRGNRHVSGCGVYPLPQFATYGDYKLWIAVEDMAGNQANHVHPDIAFGPGVFDLCITFGQCIVVNQSLGGSPDVDGDGVSDVADNCKDVPNPTQVDADLDSVGDACDPFPNDRDNEQAQCEADLAQCIASQASCPADLAQAQQDLAACQGDLASTQMTLTQTQTALTTCEGDLAVTQGQLDNATADADLDGVRDLDDACPGTMAGADVDQVGCSLDQFCEAISVQDSTGRKICLRADWKNDEPLMKTRERDCAIDRNLAGPTDDRCVAAL